MIASVRHLQYVETVDGYQATLVSMATPDPISHDNMRTQHRLLTHWLPVILWCALIFAVSHQAKETLAPIQPSGLTAQPGFMLFGIDADVIVGKGAHILAFGVLAALLYRATRFYGLSLMLTFAYAVLDEWHQSFVPGRTPRITDVGFDMLGALIALLIIASVLALKKRRLD